MSERLEGDIRLWDRLIWEPDLPHAREEVMVTEVMVNGDDETWIRTKGPGGEHWNELERVREACERHPYQIPGHREKREA